MTNPTQPTPEQLAKWREEAWLKWLKDSDVGISARPSDLYIAGYLRRCQETEQAMKLAKFGALVLQQLEIDDDSCLNAYRFASMSALFTEDAEALLPDIEATIKELLND